MHNSRNSCDLAERNHISLRCTCFICITEPTRGGLQVKNSKLQNQQCSFARDLLCHNAKDKRIGFHIQKGHQRKALLSVLFKKKNIILSKNFWTVKIKTFILASCWKIYFYRLLLLCVMSLFHFLTPSPPLLVSPLLLLLPSQLLLRLSFLILVCLLAVRLPTQQSLLLLKKNTFEFFGGTKGALQILLFGFCP